MFEVTVEDSFDFQSPEYRELYDKSEATVFQHPHWLSSLYGKLMVSNSATSLIIVVRFQADGRLAMVLPLIRRRYSAMRVIELADLRVSDYASPVTDTETFNAIVADTASVATIRHLMKPYDLLRISKLTERALPLEKLFSDRNRENMSMNAYATPLEASFPEWRQKRINRSYCKELDVKSRRLHRRGEVRFECVTDRAALITAFEALKKFQDARFANSDGVGNLLQQPAYLDFYKAVATAGLDGSARTYALWLDGQPIATTFGLAGGNAFHVILVGFDLVFKNLSIGALMFEQIARDCIERGDSLLDFTIGDEGYKLIFGAEPSAMWQISHPGSVLGYTAGLVVERLPAVKKIARRLFYGGQPAGKSASAPKPAAD